MRIPEIANSHFLCVTRDNIIYVFEDITLCFYHLSVCVNLFVSNRVVFGILLKLLSTFNAFYEHVL